MQWMVDTKGKRNMLEICTERLLLRPFRESDYDDLFEFLSQLEDDELVLSPAVETETRQTADNPKRRLRNARKQTKRSGIGTKSQQALQLQREEMKTERRQISREQRDAEAQRRFEMKQLKKKEKRRGH